MEELVIGNAGCKISEIIGILKKSPVIGQLDKKLFELARDLDTPATLKQKIRRNVVNFGVMSAADGLEEFLEEWRSREKGEAKLIKFIAILESEELNDFAQLLRDRYCTVGVPGQSTSGGNISASVSRGIGVIDQNEIITKQQLHLKRNMPALIKMTHWNASLLAMMQAHDILSYDDVQTLESTTNPGTRTKTFFQFIHDRLTGSPEAYDKVIKAFEDLCQTGVSNNLRKVYE